MGDQQAQFEQMVLALTSSENALRNQAEQAYNEVKANQPAWLIQALVEVGCKSTNAATSQLALVMLRKNFGELWNCIAEFSSEQQEHIKQSLLNRFGDPNTPHAVRKACASAIANLATRLSTAERNAWPTLWELLLNTAANDGTAWQLRAMCLEVFAQVATCLVTTYFAPQMPRFVQMLGSCISHSTPALRTKGCETIAEFVHVAADEQMPMLRQLAINVVNAYRATCDADECEDAAEQAKHILSIIEESDVTFFKDVYPPLLETLFAAASNQRLDSSSRHMAIGSIMSVGAKTKALKNNRQYVTKLFNLLFQYMLHPEIESNWEQTYEKEEDAEKKSDFDAGAQGLDRLSHIVKGKMMEELAAPVILANINNDDWKHRGAALSMLTYVFEGAIKAFMPHLDMIVRQVIVPRITDPHPYVRYSAIQCVAQFSTDMCPAFQAEYGGIVLPLVCATLQNDCPRLMCLAACTLNTFCDELDNAKPSDEDEENKVLPEDRRYKSTQFMNPFIAPMCSALFECLKAPKPVFVHSESLAALSAVIQLAEARIRPFVRDMVECSQHYLSYSAAAEEDNMLIRCRAIECTTLTASYVKKESFSEYAHDVCSYLLGVLNSGLSQADMRLRYVLRGWTCMVECLGPDVLRYLGDVMGPLLSIANSQCDAERIDKDVGEEFKDTDEIKHVRICTPGKGEHVLRMHTGLIEDKDLALTIVLNFTEELKGHMYPYMRDLTSLGLDLLKFQALSETRENAAELLRSVLRVVEDREPANVDSYIAHVVPGILEAIDEEAEAETVQVMLDALGGILVKASPGALSVEVANDAARMMYEIYELSLENINDVQQKKNDAGADQDEDELEDLEGEEIDEAELLQGVATVIGQMLRITPGFFATFESKFLPMTASLLNPAHSDTQHQIAVHLLCEFVEHGGDRVRSHLPSAIDTFMRFATHDNSEVCHAAVYGVNLAVQHVARMPRDAQVAAFVNQAYEFAGRYLSSRQRGHGDPEEYEEWQGVTCNAISLGLNIIVHFGDAVDVQTLFGVIVGHLPADDDEIEATRIHDLLCSWIVQPNHPLLGSNSPHRQRVLAALRDTALLSPNARDALNRI